MKIYTKTGDNGDTGLQGGLRVSKSHPRIAAYGAVDEANSALGIALSYDFDDDVLQILNVIQNDLFVVGADLSNSNLNDLQNRVSLDMITRLEVAIDTFDSELPPLTNFVLPGGDDIRASNIHHARAIVRRAETQTVLLSEACEINTSCIVYLNRLSDLLFVLGRLINKRGNYSDRIWTPKKLHNL